MSVASSTEITQMSLTQTETKQILSTCCQNFNQVF